MGRRVALAVHPDSGRGAAARMAGTVAARLRAACDQLELLTALTARDFHALVADCRARGLDALVVVGGDGAVHQAVQCCATTEVALGVVPCGTGNDFARALGIPTDPEAAVAAVVAAVSDGRARDIDLGRVDGVQHAGSAPRWFGTVLCTGFDAAVNARANTLPWPHGPRRYDVALARELVALRPRPVVVETETARLSLEATLVAVGNTAFYGGGIPVCPSASPDDGLVDVTVVGRVSRWDFARLGPRLRTGAHVSSPAVHTLRATRVRVDGGQDWPVFADGDPVGKPPVAVTCVPGALRVLC